MFCSISYVIPAALENINAVIALNRLSAVSFHEHRKVTFSFLENNCIESQIWRIVTAPLMFLCIVLAFAQHWGDYADPIYTWRAVRDGDFVYFEATLQTNSTTKVSPKL